MSEKQMWAKRHELKTELKQKLSYKEMDMVDELLEIERVLVRLEK